MKGIQICKGCNEKFQWQRAPSQLKQNGIPRYCNNQCRVKHKKGKITKSGTKYCETCSKEYKYKVKITGNSRWCSHKCKPKNFTESNLEKYLLKLFDERVVINDKGCWGWIGNIDCIQGYARIYVRKKNYSAHRISWIKHYGKIPKDKQINHHCDNRICTRPDHLYLGTQEENENDKRQRNRQAKGEKNGFAKLDDEKVRKIKEMLKQEFTCAKIARDFSVSTGCIWFIKNDKNWKHVKV